MTRLRAGIRKLLMVADKHTPAVSAVVRAGLCRDDDYAAAGKPLCNWDDPAAREALIDALVRDCHALADLDNPATYEKEPTTLTAAWSPTTEPARTTPPCLPAGEPHPTPNNQDMA